MGVANVLEVFPVIKVLLACVSGENSQHTSLTLIITLTTELA